MKTEDDFFKKNPEMIATFAIKDGKLIFDYNDDKISVSEMILVLHNTVHEYLKTIHMQATKLNNTKEETKKEQ